MHFESIRLFAFCEAMNWGNLPVAGGLYNQHPQLLDEWMYIFTQRTEHESRRRAQEEAQAARTKRKSGRR